jgi:hypothetical protein
VPAVSSVAIQATNCIKFSKRGQPTDCPFAESETDPFRSQEPLDSLYFFCYYTYKVRVRSISYAAAGLSLFLFVAVALFQLRLQLSPGP